MRYAGPLLFLLAAAWVWNTNAGSDGSYVVVFPFLDAIVGTDPMAQGQLTWKILLGLGVFFFFTAIVGHIRDIRARSQEED